MKFSNRQKGLGFAGWLILILVFGGGITMGMKLFPLYLDHNTMSGVLDGMAEEAGMANKPVADLKDIAKNRFSINNVRGFDLNKNMQIKRESNVVSIILDYEVRVPLAGNVDLIAKFYKAVDLKK